MSEAHIFRVETGFRLAAEVKDCQSNFELCEKAVFYPQVNDPDGIFLISDFNRKWRLTEAQISGKLVHAFTHRLTGHDEIVEKSESSYRGLCGDLDPEVLAWVPSHGFANDRRDIAGDPSFWVFKLVLRHAGRVPQGLKVVSQPA
jgi:hypothetical protein